MPDIDNPAQMLEQLLEALHHNGALPQATAKEGDALRMGAQAGMQVPERRLQKVLLQDQTLGCSNLKAGCRIQKVGRRGGSSGGGR